jgi:glycerol-3-phosphate acyltransferase PlsY
LEDDDMNTVLLLLVAWLLGSLPVALMTGRVLANRPT